ncbi:hypothetical protein T492DRAFT_886414 [Pavlovales sp. CCMP2436]|nr:hypothetical protein T492DRAFT_886414 [Pavlovales sp. CCMP2436]
MGCSLTMGNHQMLLFGLWFTKAKADLERKERIRLRMREVTGLTELLAVQAAAQSTVADAAAVVDGGGGPRSGGGGGGGGGGKPEKLVLYMDLEFYDYSSASAISHPANAQLARVLAVDLSQSSFGGNGGGGGGTKHHAHGKLAKKMGGGGGGGGSGGGGGGGGGGEKAKGGAVAASAAVERAAAKPEVEAQKAHKAE